MDGECVSSSSELRAVAVHPHPTASLLRPSLAQVFVTLKHIMKCKFHSNKSYEPAISGGRDEVVLSYYLN